MSDMKFVGEIYLLTSDKRNREDIWKFLLFSLSIKETKQNKKKSRWELIDSKTLRKGANNEKRTMNILAELAV